MPVAKFVKDNLVLVVGLTLPILLMAGFLLASALPGRLDPPKYDMVLATQEYPQPPIPITVRLVVKDHVLVAQYVRLAPVSNGAYQNGSWRKLFRYEAASGTVRELSFDLPMDMESITDGREDVVDATKGLRLDAAVRAPDGYEFGFGSGRSGGLLLEIFGGSRNYEARLRKEGRSIPIPPVGDTAFINGGVDFVGWVTGGN